MGFYIKNFYFADKKIKICAYCRVSTDKNDQTNSLENQIKFFENYNITKLYIDEGISGTAVKNRKGFLSMIEDAEKGEFDYIITKEISRFARNTLDSIYYTRLLKELGVGVYFLNDNINTLDPDAELRLTIMSSIAQEESRKTSERVKWGQKRQMEKGIVFGKSMLGYNVINGEIFIEEKGAEIVKKIFTLYLKEDMSTYSVAEYLNKNNVKTNNGNKWSATAVLRILKNEKYCGDLLQKKTYTPNYLTHEKRLNKGEEDIVLIKNHHKPIISRKMFKAVQNKLKTKNKHGF